MKKIKIDMTPHIYREQFITALVEQGYTVSMENDLSNTSSKVYVVIHFTGALDPIIEGEETNE